MNGRIITTNGIFGAIRGNASHSLARLGRLRTPENAWE